MNDKEKFEEKADLKELPPDTRSRGYISPNYPNEREKRRSNRIDFIKYLLYTIAAALVVIPMILAQSRLFNTVSDSLSKI